MSGKQQALYRNKLLWRCRRGTRELDVLLSRYIHSHYDQADSKEQQCFAEMLEWPDPQLFACLSASPEEVQRATGDPHIAHIVRLIHACH